MDDYYDHPLLLFLMMVEFDEVDLTPPPSRGGPMSLKQLGTVGLGSLEVIAMQRCRPFGGGTGWKGEQSAAKCKEERRCG